MPPLRPSHVAAYEAGRRLREEARMRRSRIRPPAFRPTGIRPPGMHLPGTRPRWNAPPPRRLPAAAVRTGVLRIAGAMAAATFIGLILFVGVIAVLSLLLATAITNGKALLIGAIWLTVGAGSLALVRGHRRHARLRRGGAAGTAPLPPRRPAPPRPDLVWAHARKRFHALRAAYAAFECDAMAVLRLPALADVSVPSTGRFVDAFAEAQALETDALPPPQHLMGFVAAVDRAERAWRAAREAAERIRLSGLSPEERRTVELVIKLLTAARHSGSDAERLAAYSRARSELAKLDSTGALHLPRPAQSALDAAAQPALPA